MKQGLTKRRWYLINMLQGASKCSLQSKEGVDIMSVKVRIPTPLQKLTENKSLVSAEGVSIREVLVNLEKTYPGIKERLCDEHGTVKRFINVYLNDEDIRFLNGEDTKVKAGDEISIIPAIAGGSAVY
jgi:molybdopterin synthase sulfur carrier subunit